VARYQRWNALLDLLPGDGQLTVAEAARALSVSEATIRRDLDQLAKQQLVTRTRGGATAGHVSYDLPLRYKTARHGPEKQRIGRLDSLVAREFLDQHVGFCGVRAAEDGPRVRVDVPDLVLVTGVATEVRPVAVVDEREDAAADRHAWLTLVSGVLPRLTIGVNLLALLYVERLAGLIIFERRALEIHAQFRGPPGRRVGTRTPPDPLAQSFCIGLEAQQPRRIGKHGPWVGFREALASQQFEERFSVAPRHVGGRLAVTRRIAEISPAVDNLFR